MAKNRSLDYALDRIDRASSEMTEAGRRLERVANISDEKLRDISNEAIEDIKPEITAMLLSNFDNSGIGKSNGQYKSTGKLRSAIRGSLILISRNGKSIRIMMPPNVDPYVKGDSKSDFYSVAASLNYGAVRTPRMLRNVVDLPTGKVSGVKSQNIIGAKAKRSIKKNVLGGQISASSKAAIERGATGRKGRRLTAPVKLGTIHTGEKSGTIKTDRGQITVIRPRPFFFLLPSQRQTIASLYDDAVEKRVNWLLS